MLKSKNIFFLHVPKTGGTSFQAWVKSQGSSCDVALAGHYTYRKQWLMPTDISMAFVRDPVDRMLSSYCFWYNHVAIRAKAGLGRMPTWNEYCEMVMDGAYDDTRYTKGGVSVVIGLEPQVECLVDWDGKVRVTHLVPFEKLDTAIDIVRGYFPDVTGTELPHLNVCKGDKPEVTQGQVAAIRWRYAADWELYQKVRDGIYVPAN